MLSNYNANAIAMVMLSIANSKQYIMLSNTNAKQC